MEWFLVALPGLGCAAMMVGMMWLMVRGGMSMGQSTSSPGGGNRSAEHDEKLRELGDEVERLRAQVRDREREVDQL